MGFATSLEASIALRLVSRLALRTALAVRTGAETEATRRARLVLAEIKAAIEEAERLVDDA